MATLQAQLVGWWRRLLGWRAARSQPIAALVVGGAVLAVLIVGGGAFFLSGERSQHLVAAERQVGTLSVVLATQTDRQFEALQTMQRGLIERMRLDGIDDEAAFVRRMSGRDVYELLRQQIKPLPFMDAASLIGADGRVVNFSRHWPVPTINVSDRDYFQALENDPQLEQFVSKPVRNRGTGTWTIYLARRFTSRDGHFLGLVLGMTTVAYFEDYFRTILPGPDSAIALFRDDGMLLARYPRTTATIGVTYPDMARNGTPDATASAPAYIHRAIDGSQRIVARRALGQFPLSVAVSMSEATALADWHHEVLALGLIIAVAVTTIVSTMYFAARSVGSEIRRRNRTASMRAERAETLLTEAIESIAEGFVVYDADDRLVLCNGAYRKFYPRTAPAIVPGAKFVDILRYGLAHGEYREAVGREEEWLADRLRLHREPTGTHEQVLADGRHILVVERRTESGLTAGLRLDVTARKIAEAHLHRTQKMDSIGQLTGGIAHDFNNLLATIVTNLDLLLAHAGGNAKIAGPANEAIAAAMRGAELTKRLLAFARKQPLRPQPVDVPQQIAALTEMLERTLGGAVTLSVAVPDDVWPVLADSAQLDSAIVNLVVNARDAMPSGGTITIETANLRFDAGDAGLYLDFAPGDYVALAVSDTGIGMSRETQARAFEPFFTTKAPGKGTGLGLSMVYGFAQQSRGHVRIYSELGHGTTVKLFLPRATLAPALAAAQKRAPTALPRGRESVLLAEDNASLRRTTSRVLADLGYRVHEAEDGVGALDILRSGTPIDLLFTDLVMPGGISGYDLAVEAHRRRPDLKVLFTSGFAEAAARNGQCDDEFAAPILSKPYRREEVARRVRAALDGA